MCEFVLALCQAQGKGKLEVYTVLSLQDENIRIAKLLFYLLGEQGKKACITLNVSTESNLSSVLVALDQLLFLRMK